MLPEEANADRVPVTRRIHIGYLDSLRALAALYVVAFHSVIETPGWTAPAGIQQIVVALCGFGHYAVDLFIVLSGFCLMLPVVRGDGTLRGGPVEFFKRRARRILPPYYFAVLASCLAILLFIHHKTGTIWDQAIPITLGSIFAHIFLVQDLKRGSAANINHALWSISVEWRIYFLFPLMVAAWRRVNPFLVTLIAIAAGYALLLILGNPRLHLLAYPDLIIGIMPQYLGLFAIGMLAAGIAFSQDAKLAARRARGQWVAVLIALMAIVIFLSEARLGRNGQVIPVAYTDLFVGLFSGALIVFVSIGETNALRRILSWRPLVFVGTFAYSIYLIHAPVLQIVWQYLWNPLHLGPSTVLWLQLVLGLPITVIAAYLFFLICERPFLNVHKHESPAEIERDAALSPAP